jgi:hypothetical protein
MAQTAALLLFEAAPPFLGVSMQRSRILGCICLIFSDALYAGHASQEKKAAPSSHPAPQVTGRLFHSEGGLLTLQYKHNSGPAVFVGKIQSACMLPREFNSGESKPLDVATVPMGTVMTVFYVRHAVGKESANTILGVRFEHVPPGSTLPVGVNIPCFKAQDTPARK